MSISSSMKDFVTRTAQAVYRWQVKLDINDNDTDETAGEKIINAIKIAAKKASEFSEGPFYYDDHPWTNNGIRGLTHERMKEEVLLAQDKMIAAQEEWGIMARVSCEDDFFDIPIALDIDEPATRNILERMKGMEATFVNVELVGDLFPGKDFTIQFHADNWCKLREISNSGVLPLDSAMFFRRPVVWDLFRAEFSELEFGSLPEFTEDEFYARLGKSSRFDQSLIESSKNSVLSLSEIAPKPMSIEWGRWFPVILDLINLIGKPRPMDGISILLNFLVEEPVDGVRDEEGDLVEKWSTVALHNMIVCYGLHPLAAPHILEFVRKNPMDFYDLPETENRRYVLAGASAIHDSMLSVMRASTVGRLPVYEKIVELEKQDVIED